MAQPILCRPQLSKLTKLTPVDSHTHGVASPGSPLSKPVAVRPGPPLRHPSELQLVRTGPPTLATSLVLSRLSNSPTLLPENIARLISAISLVARLSIRASGLFIEALLEACQLGTIGGLALTRRMLITAVGSARTLQYVNQSLDWSGRDEEGNKTT